MNKFWKAVLINVGAVYAAALATLALGDNTGLLILPIFLSVIEFVVGILFSAFSKSNTGQIMLAASGIIFLIGLGVCSVYPLRI